jgi:anti-anti-sigma regulatory factor
MILTQRQIHHGVFGLLTVGGLLLLMSSLAIALNTVAIATILIATVLSGGLWIAYWQGLEDAHTQRARLVILDIAGVSVVDTAVAQALLQTAHALRLLGCTVFLSGIAADVATTLVQLGIGLEGITPVRNPQDGLARFESSLQNERAPSTRSP